MVGLYMRPIDKIIFHCSASDSPAHDDVAVMRKWHIARGFNDVGYHYFIKKNGDIQTGRPLAIVGAHTQSHNTGSVGVCFHGLNDFTAQQLGSIHQAITMIEGTLGKRLALASHRDFTNQKTCPNFVLNDFLNGKVTIIKKYPVKAGLLSDTDIPEDVCELDND
jgi:hypothetical protein